MSPLLRRMLALAALAAVPGCSTRAMPAREMDAGKTLALSAAPAPSPPMNTEQYDRIEENGFLDPRVQPLSTFSIDVDTASYTNVRRMLDEGRLPPAGAVRIEEFLNYFTYEYAGPSDGRPFAVVTEVAACPWAEGHRLVHVGIQARRVPDGQVPPRNLVFLLDVSGSMQDQAKLPLVKSAMKLLAERLRPEDRVAIVVYAGASGLALPSTGGGEKEAILDAVESLEAGGSTNGGEGIRLAYRVAKENFRTGAINRVILATDGDFNVGTTSRDELVALIEKERESGVFLTVLGVGTGNLKDSQMEELADRGNGNYHYLDTVSEARKVLVSEAGGTLVTVAKDVKLQVEFNPARVGAYRLIGYENRLLAAEDFHDDRKDAGEIGAGHSVTAIYEITPPGVLPGSRGVDALRYQAPKDLTAAAAGPEILTLKIRYKEPAEDQSRLLSFAVPDPGRRPAAGASDDFRFSAAAAAFGMLLRGSKHAGSATWDSVRDLARGALGPDPDGYRGEFLRMVAKARELGNP